MKVACRSQTVVTRIQSDSSTARRPKSLDGQKTQERLTTERAESGRVPTSTDSRFWSIGQVIYGNFLNIPMDLMMPTFCFFHLDDCIYLGVLSLQM